VLRKRKRSFPNHWERTRVRRGRWKGPNRAKQEELKSEKKKDLSHKGEDEEKEEKKNLQYRARPKGVLPK